MIRIAETQFDAAGRLTDFTRRAEAAGAIVSFVGAVRPSADGVAVEALELEHYPGVTEASIARIETEARNRWPISDVDIVHRVGRIPRGETIVFVAVAAAHRRAAFAAADFIMDFLKTEAMFWKKEIGADGARWIEPRSADYRDAQRWREEA